MAIPEDLATIARQEAELRLPGFHRGRHPPFDAVRRRGRASALP
jgi:hypothetical protein